MARKMRPWRKLDTKDCPDSAEENKYDSRRGSPNWTRTSDKLINSQLLYQLSYRGMPLEAGGISKAFG